MELIYNGQDENSQLIIMKINRILKSDKISDLEKYAFFMDEVRIIFNANKKANHAGESEDFTTWVMSAFATAGVFGLYTNERINMLHMAEAVAVESALLASFLIIRRFQKTKEIDKLEKSISGTMQSKLYKSISENSIIEVPVENINACTFAELKKINEVVANQDKVNEYQLTKRPIL